MCQDCREKAAAKRKAEGKPYTIGAALEEGTYMVGELENVRNGAAILWPKWCDIPLEILGRLEAAALAAAECYGDAARMKRQGIEEVPNGEDQGPRRIV